MRPTISTTTTATSGRILEFIRSGAARSRKEIEALSGLSRATVANRLAALQQYGLIAEDHLAPSSGGRPAQRYRLAQDYGQVVGIDVGEEAARIALFNLTAAPVDELVVEIDLTAAPLAVIGKLAEAVRRLLARRKSMRPVLGVGLSLPAPVDFAAGRVTAPSVMRGWEHLSLKEELAAAFGMPVSLDNDVNLMALAEQRLYRPETEAFIFIKAGTGIGCGIIYDGLLFRGTGGLSGDIGHIQLPQDKPALCRCGKKGCIEAHAAGWALARDLRALGHEARTARDVMALYETGDSRCLNLITESARLLGEVTAELVSILNPQTIVLGGQLAAAGERMLAGIREKVYGRCLPLATQDLVIDTARGDEKLGIAGASMLAIDNALSPAKVDALLRQC